MINLKEHFKTQELNEKQKNKVLYSSLGSNFPADFNFSFDLKCSEFRS